jgi:hypothetical protein
MLNPDQIRARPAPHSLGPKSISELSDAWRAITSPEPEILLAFLGGPATEFSDLIPSARALLDRYPHKRVGINRAEFTLLRSVKEHGPRASAIVAHAIISNSGHDLWDDGWLFSRLLHLGQSSLSDPAVVVSGDTTRMHTCEVGLTPTGSRLLSGDAHFVELNGIDDSVLGVRLRSDRDSVWYRTADSVVRASH